MGGVVIETLYDKAINEGHSKGLEEGLERGRQQGFEQGIEKGKITEFITLRKEDGYTDRRIMNNLIKRFHMTPEDARKELAEFEIA